MQTTYVKKSKNCCTKCLIGTFLYILILFFLVFATVFVIIPVVFKYSIGIQRNIIFPTWYMMEKNYSNPEYYGLKGAKNFYINVSDATGNISLGAWQILPSNILSDVMENNEYWYENILENENHDILLYLHGNAADRTLSLELYTILRKYFHIFAVDYRAYADSSKVELTENGIVNDTVQIYKWLYEKSKSDIYLWGHSLGSAVATHTISNLKAQNMTPTGLILETPFTSVTDIMELHPVVKFYSWLPWYRSTLLTPMDTNGFGFNSKKYIVDVDCPIMILHATDDTIIPYDNAAKLSAIATSERNKTSQGDVIFHTFEDKGYDHMFIYLAPELPEYVSKFISECRSFQNKTQTI